MTRPHVCGQVVPASRLRDAFLPVCGDLPFKDAEKFIKRAV